ncbi:MAG: hypothetical protein M1839_007312 [Geoglossum umbratile]|nr:MAG: hypothetical protein M1839_007312 [Geoglossum umbratile]
MGPPQENVFQAASENGSSTKFSLLNHTAAGEQEAAAGIRNAEPAVDKDSDFSGDDGERHSHDDVTEESAGSVIGVSISHVQTRLTSPLTPMAEKVATLESMGGMRQFDEDSDDTGKTTAGLFAKGEPGRRARAGVETMGASDLPREKQLAAPPSPWLPSPKRAPRSDASKNILRDLPAGTRPRSSSGPTGGGGKRFFPFSLPSIPKSPSLSSFGFPSLNSPLPFLPGHKGNPANGGSRLQVAKSEAPSNDSTVPVVSIAGTGNLPCKRSGSGLQSTIGVSTGTGNPAPEYPPSQISPVASRDIVGQQLEVPPVRHGRQDRPRPLRRATSDNSLSLRYTLSRVSSLGDDSKFESVHSQVNSRFKAIRDSFHDTNFTFPSMPSINISLKADGSIKKKRTITPITVGVTQGGSTLPELSDAHLDSQAKATDTPRLSDNGMNRGLLNALDKLTGDAVIMGGYRGSKLRSAKSPYHRVWIPIKVGLNLRKVDLEVGLSPEDEENMEETIVPGGMLTHIGPVDISRRLLKRLQQCENARNGRLRVWDYGYDWRLSPHLLSMKLTKFLEGLPSNAGGLPPSERGALVIAHSLGGLITRHAVNMRPDLFSGVIYAGTPQSCVNILGPLRNGDEVLLSSRVLTAQVNFTIRTSFMLLPEDGKCFTDRKTKEEYPVDFFDVESWIKYRFSPCVAPPLPTSSSTISLGSLVGSVSGSLSSLSLSLKNRRDSYPERLGGPVLKDTHNTPTSGIVDSPRSGKVRTLAPQLGSKPHPSNMGSYSNTSVSTAVTISSEDAITYLRHTLAETLRFKQELHYRPEHGRNNAYPPLAVIYGKTVPTVYGARVLGRDGIMRADAYDDLAFASGDGVCLAREAMLPKGYQIVKCGRLTKEDEAATGSDEVEVRREDQDNINRFSRLHQRETLLEEELKAKQKDKEDLEEVSTELELADEDDLIPFKIGDSFVSLPLPEVQELLSKSTGRIDTDMERLEEKLEKVRGEMVELKVVLYARFGRSINLET